MTDILHYRGDRTKFNPQQLYGPDMFGAFYVPVSAEYDFERDQTTITFRPIPPAELQQRIGGDS